MSGDIFDIKLLDILFLMFSLLESCQEFLTVRWKLIVIGHTDKYASRTFKSRVSISLQTRLRDKLQ